MLFKGECLDQFCCQRKNPQLQYWFDTRMRLQRNAFDDEGMLTMT